MAEKMIKESVHKKALERVAKYKQENEELNAKLEASREVSIDLAKRLEDAEKIADMAHQESMTMSDQIHFYKKLIEETITKHDTLLSSLNSTLEMSKDGLISVVNKLRAGGNN